MASTGCGALNIRGKIHDMGELTQLLRAVRAGEKEALGRLFSLAYEQLRDLAHQRLRTSQGDGALNTTALVHECYLRFARMESLSLEDRAHFTGYAGRVMRSVIIDFARERLSQRRGADVLFVTLATDIPEQETVSAERLLRIDTVLQELGRSQPRLVQVVELKYFAGFTLEEISQSLGVAPRTVRRDWDRARLLLLAALET
jgi:RNA polymerase sigma factor (TIGR02999 family)